MEESKIKSIILSIKVSKTNEKGPLAAEQMFANLHGILRHVSKTTECKVNQEYYSLEIANIRQNIHFLAWMPEYLKDFFEAQVYAQYPDIEIAEVQDYIQFKEYASIATCELEFTKHDIFPIKSYEEFEDQITRQSLDTLSSITESLRNAVLSPNEHIALQILCKPVNGKPNQINVFETVKRIKKGKKIFIFGNEKSLYVEKPSIIRMFLSLLEIFNIKRFSEGTLDTMSKKSKSDILSDGKLDIKINKDSLADTIEKALLDKSSKLMYRVIVRVTYYSENEIPEETMYHKVQSVASSFKQFNSELFNGFDSHVEYGLSGLAYYKTRKFRSSSGILLNSSELASLFHFPNELVKTPNIVWVTSKKTEAPVDLPDVENTMQNDLTLLGRTTFRGAFKEFGIRLDDRRRHIYIIGKTGMGKSTLLENMIFSDLVAGKGVGVIDPHGELADHVLNFVPDYRKEDVIVVDPSDVEFPVAINMLENVGTSEGRSIIASGIVSVFKKMFAESWGPRLEHVLRNTIMALLEAPETSMMGIMRILVDEDYRNEILSYVTDPVVLSFWQQEFANFNPKNVAEIISPIQNKVGQFLSSSIVRNIVGQTKTTINIREAMDNKKILIVNLSKGKIGEDNSALLGSMLITRFQLDAMSRANISEEKREDFYLYVDEFQNFATDSFATILSEARKYKLNLTIANQYTAQMAETVRDAVFGNVGSILSFQTGFDDAEIFEHQMGEVVTAADITSLEKYHIYVRLLINGMPSPAFSAKTLPPPDIEIEPNHRENLVNLSRSKYSQNRKKVETMINEWAKQQKASSSKETTQKKKKAEPHIKVDDLQVGQTVKANVIGIVDYGLFLSFQGIEGLLHMSKIPPDKKNILKEVKKGDLIEVMILEKKEGEKLAYTLTPVEEVVKMEKKIEKGK